MYNEELAVAGIASINNQCGEYGEVSGKLGHWNFYNKDTFWLANPLPRPMRTKNQFISQESRLEATLSRRNAASPPSPR